MRYFPIIFSAIIIAVLNITNCWAQESINQDVKVVKAYSPTVSDAFKISYMPVLDDSTTYNPKFNYRILSASVETNYQPATLSPAKINTSRKEYLHKSYIKGGVGNYSTFLGELGYNILADEKYVLGLNVGHLSSFGDITLENDVTADAPYGNTWAAADFKHFFDDKTLNVNIDFIHNTYRYYGFQTLNSDNTYWLSTGNGTGNLIPGNDLIPDDKQRLSGFKASIGIANNESDERKTKYSINGEIDAFGNRTGVNQLGFNIGGTLYRPVNNIGFGLEALIGGYKTSVPDTIGPMFTFNDRSQTIIKVNPSLNFNFDRARLKVGLLIAGVIDTQGDEFYLTPDILGELTVVEGIATVYGGITGKVNLNDYRSIQYENIFASPDVNVKSSVYGLNLIAGIKGNFSSSTSFAAGVEYGFFNNEHFWINKNYQLPPPSPEVMGNYHHSNLFDVVYDDGSLLTVKGELLYKPKAGVEINLEGAYYGWNLDDLKEAWHMPEVELGARANFNVLKNVYASLGVKYLGERMAFDISEEDQVKKLKGVVDLNIGGEYYFSKQWSFWVSVNNLAATKYYKWNGYPMQGLNAKAGVIYAF